MLFPVASTLLLPSHNCEWVISPDASNLRWWWRRASCPRMSVDISKTNRDQCYSMVHCCFTSTETIKLIRTGRPGRPPRLSLSSWTQVVIWGAKRGEKYWWQNPLNSHLELVSQCCFHFPPQFHSQVSSSAVSSKSGCRPSSGSSEKNKAALPRILLIAETLCCPR